VKEQNGNYSVIAGDAPKSGFPGKAGILPAVPGVSRGTSALVARPAYIKYPMGHWQAPSRPDVPGKMPETAGETPALSGNRNAAKSGGRFSLAMFGVILLPDFALQAALRHRPELWTRPVAVLEETGAANKAFILQLTGPARAAGVLAGMSSSQGLARCRELLLLPRAREQETAASAALLESGFSCSPWVEATGEGICTFELRANARESCARTENVPTQLARLHLAARIGLADNPDLALLAAHHADPFLCVTDSRAFLADLPVSALAPAPAIAAILQQWGVRTLGALTALPEEALTERLGPEGHMLWQRAAGRTQRLLRLAIPPAVYEESIEFEHEIETLEPLLFIVRRFLDQLVARLAAAYRVPGELELVLTFASGEEHRGVFRIPSPTADVEVLFRVVHTHLEDFTASSPITALRLGAKPARPPSQQFGLFETALRNPNGFYETLARLGALLGADRAGCAVPADTHRPDRFEIAVPDFLNLASSSPAGGGRVAEEPAVYGPPLRRFRPPVPAQVEVVAGEPVRMLSAEGSGGICARRGPYQISGDWWDQAWSCEEWDVELAGRQLYRISHQPDGWFVEGVYD
jgi:protein ImuB